MTSYNWIIVGHSPAFFTHLSISTQRSEVNNFQKHPETMERTDIMKYVQKITCSAPIFSCVYIIFRNVGLRMHTCIYTVHIYVWIWMYIIYIQYIYICMHSSANPKCKHGDRQWWTSGRRAAHVGTPACHGAVLVWIWRNLGELRNWSNIMGIQSKKTTTIGM